MTGWREDREDTEDILLRESGRKVGKQLAVVGDHSEDPLLPGFAFSVSESIIFELRLDSELIPGLDLLVTRIVTARRATVWSRDESDAVTDSFSFESDE
jgi:hypothetical protein